MDAAKQLGRWEMAGKIKDKQTIVKGFLRAPEAILPPLLPHPWLLPLPLRVHLLHHGFKLRLLLEGQELSHLFSRLLPHGVHIRVGLFVDRLHLVMRLVNDPVDARGLIGRQPYLFRHFRYALCPSFRFAQRWRPRQRRRQRAVRNAISEYHPDGRPEDEYQCQPQPRLLPRLNIHGCNSSCVLATMSSFNGVFGTVSNNPSTAGRVCCCLLCSARRNSSAHVPPSTSSTAANAASLGASLITLIQTPLVCSSSSRSFATIAAITRDTNHGPGSAALSAMPAMAARVSAKSSSAAAHSAHFTACSRAAGGNISRQFSAAFLPGSPDGKRSNSSKNSVQPRASIGRSLILPLPPNPPSLLKLPQRVFSAGSLPLSSAAPETVLPLRCFH